MEYQLSKERITASEALATGATLTLEAKDIHNERGPHAVVSIIVKGQGSPRTLAWDDLAINKSEERTRLANKAHKYLDAADTIVLDDGSLRLLLDDFCAGLWEAWVAILEPTEVAGALERKATDYLLPPYVARGKGSIMFSPPKTGKSQMGYLIAVSVDSGQGHGLWNPKQAKAMIVNLERDAESVAQRLGSINAILGFPRNRRLLTLNAKGRRLTDVIGAVRKAVEKHKVEFGLLDSLSRVGVKLIADDEVNGACDVLNSTFPAWLALGHTPRQDTSHVFGSQMWDAAADILIKLRSTQAANGPLGISLEAMWANDSPRQAPNVYSLEFDSLGLIGARKAGLLDFPDLAKDLPQDVKAQLLTYLRERGRATATEAADELGLNRGQISHLLLHDRAFDKAGKEGRNQFYSLRPDVLRPGNDVAV